MLKTLLYHAPITPFHSHKHTSPSAHRFSHSRHTPDTHETHLHSLLTSVWQDCTEFSMEVDARSCGQSEEIFCLVVSPFHVVLSLPILVISFNDCIYFQFSYSFVCFVFAFNSYLYYQENSGIQDVNHCCFPTRPWTPFHSHQHTSNFTSPALTSKQTQVTQEAHHTTHLHSSSPLSVDRLGFKDETWHRFHSHSRHAQDSYTQDTPLRGWGNIFSKPPPA